MTKQNLRDLIERFNFDQANWGEEEAQVMMWQNYNLLLKGKEMMEFKRTGQVAKKK